MQALNMDVCIYTYIYTCVQSRGVRFNQLWRLIDCLPRIDSQSRGERPNRLIAQEYYSHAIPLIYNHTILAGANPGMLKSSTKQTLCDITECSVLLHSLMCTYDY